MKRAFLTGLALLLPLALTLFVVVFLTSFITKPLSGLMRELLLTLGTQEPFLTASSQLLALFFFFAFIFLIGFLANSFLFKAFFDRGNRVIEAIPLIGRVYIAFKEVFSSLLFSKMPLGQQVVLVPYPSIDTLAIALLMQEHEGGLVSVLVPGAPNPSMGFILFFKKERVIYTDMTLRAAFQAVISCGSRFDSFNICSHDQKDTHH